MTDNYGRDWINTNSVPIIEKYGTITLRHLHYLLVSQGMPNTLRQYKRVISAMTEARWDGRVEFTDFDDHERELIGHTAYEDKDLFNEIERAKEAIKAWLTSHGLNRWSNQENYLEVWIEKKSMQGDFQGPCTSMDVALFPCKGYPSLTWLYKAKERFEEAQATDKNVVVLYFGDYDPSGEDIPRSIGDNLRRMGISIEIDRIALMKEQVIEWGLPPAPTKDTDSRSANWDGLGQVELEAIDPHQLQQMAKDAIGRYFNMNLFRELRSREATETKEYRRALKKWFNAQAGENK